MEAIDQRPPSELDDSALLAQVRGCQRARSRIDAREACLLAELERRKAYVRAGAVDAVAWLKDEAGLSGREARKRTQLAEGLSALPETAAALAEGKITADHAQALAKIVTDTESRGEEHGRAVQADEARLIKEAKGLSADEFGRAVRRFCDAVDRDAGLSRHERARARRQARLTPPDETGLGRLTAELHPEAYSIVSTTIGRVADELWRADGGRDADTTRHRTLRQRQADALVEVCRRSTSVGPEATHESRPTIVVTMGYGSLVGALREHRAGLDPTSDEHQTLSGVLDGDQGPVPAPLARRLACDADIIPAVLGSRTEPLDVGRAHRLPTRAQRRALVLRDGRCRFPGCDRSHHWCEAHHLRTWLEGGPTDLDNLVLLCSKHHHAVHEGGWRLTGTAGDLEARPPPDHSRPPRAGPHTRAA